MVYFDRVLEVGLLLLTVVSLYSSSFDIYGTAVGQYLMIFTKVLTEVLASLQFGAFEKLGDSSNKKQQLLL